MEVRRHEDGTESVLGRHGEGGLGLSMESIALSAGMVKGRGKTVRVGQREWMRRRLGEGQRLTHSRSGLAGYPRIHRRPASRNAESDASRAQQGLVNQRTRTPATGEPW